MTGIRINGLPCDVCGGKVNHTPNCKRTPAYMDTPPASLTRKIAESRSKIHDNHNPLWQGPCGEGWNGGVTQTLLGNFFVDRERFRLKYILGLYAHDRWNHRLGYGNMWHECERAAAAELSWSDGELNGIDTNNWMDCLDQHTGEMMKQYPFQKDEILKWWNVCCVQFPEYVKYWSTHPDVKNRTPLLQEQAFDIPYKLPSGRVVRLRGKWDSVDFIPAHSYSYKDNSEMNRGYDGCDYPDGIWIQENKTKSDIDKLKVERQLKFDLQSMMYLIALNEYKWGLAAAMEKARLDWPYPILGVRYNVVRRPLSGGKGNISPHKAKVTKKTFTPAETEEHFYARLRDDYIAKEPDYWFFRVRVDISQRDIQVFKDTCLHPVLEHLCDWYDQVTNNQAPTLPKYRYIAPMHYRTPYGIYNPLSDGGETEYDAMLESGNEVGLRRVEELFWELK